MPFGLTNAPTVFQHMANDIFRDLLDICLVIYLDDLLVNSKTQEEHDSYVLLVQKRLRKHGLYAKLEKCSLDDNQVGFLGYINSSEGISMAPAKVKTVIEWQTPVHCKRCNVELCRPVPFLRICVLFVVLSRNTLRVY